MKIFSIGPANPLRGGIARFNESFASSLKSKGIEVEVVSFHFLYPKVFFPGKTQFTSSPPPEDLTIHTIIHPLNPFNWRRTAAKIINDHPDFVVFHYWMPFFAPAYGFIARLVKKKLPVKTFAIAHNLIPHEKQPFMTCFTRYFLRSLDGVITLSESVLLELENISPGKKGIFLPHPLYDIYGEKQGRDESLERLGLPKDKQYLLFFGLVRDYKGLDILLEALQYCRSENYKLLIAGEFYGKKSSYLEIINRKNLEHKVIIRDYYIPDEEVKYYFSVADLVVQPYKSATQSGITQIAYHFDCPMLVTNVGGLAEIVPHQKAGYVVNPDPEDIATAIDEFLLKADKSKFISFIKKEKDKFSWDNFVQRFLGFAGRLQVNNVIRE